ncbi:ImmA/IrrE family metallo-endopeptidase [Staphylococcus epidermidis]|uniref:ImmA/IrrE family metallo-endopeptidase n=1 Tax=Staphylococcus TaxID=1279 RepID=UPI00066CBC4B|nr:MULTISPECIES: ImmA/IrrE family metallo-endopeptidase [Staphylococcus]MBM5831016.1 ImmA/IrrE family metallo-endopeptidase [Staphylococcus epidermidis]MBM5833315.1 ImmA/IrrE family metallo-endopeptidase [Staphylococcus epidermidis]MBM5842333.1 ImmA/IrrE family metallo-endopeptidase [Staphylococcus epidermidis]MBM5846862.1 ImmA/IrrE family metallo-endopeptidase [Staphylococcus epidermidis]MBM5864857.1 ImmA/IrrE family metallo-endopeptidase [Staphylococcus epidermidis]
MGKYEDLMIKYDHLPITETKYMPDFMSGLYLDGEIFINDNRSVRQKLETLAEEIAHHKLTHGNITNSDEYNNRKFENYARRYAKETVISLDGLIEAHRRGINSLYELSEFFEVTEEYVLDCLNHYKSKYGLSVIHDDYTIYFEPLSVIKNKRRDAE